MANARHRNPLRLAMTALDHRSEQQTESYLNKDRDRRDLAAMVHQVYGDVRGRSAVDARAVIQPGLGLAETSPAVLRDVPQVVSPDPPPWNCSCPWAWSAAGWRLKWPHAGCPHHGEPAPEFAEQLYRRAVAVRTEPEPTVTRPCKRCGGQVPAERWASKSCSEVCALILEDRGEAEVATRPLCPICNRPVRPGVRAHRTCAPRAGEGRLADELPKSCVPHNSARLEVPVAGLSWGNGRVAGCGACL